MDYSIGNDGMSLAVTITGNADSAVAAAEQTGNALKGMEGVSDTAIASLTAAIEKLGIDFTQMSANATKSAESVAKVGTSAGATATLLEDANRAGGAGARMFSALGIEAGQAAARVEAFTGVLGEMRAMAPELVAIGAGIAAIGGAFTFFKDGIQDAEQLQVDMDRLRAVVDEQGQSWSAASEQVKKFIETESMASGIPETQLAAAFSELAGKIHDVHDAEVIMRVAEEESIATGKSLEEITNALLEAEAGRGMELAQLDPRLKSLIHDHADMHTILKVLHDDNVKALEDQNSANMSWARAKVTLEAMGESIGDAVLPALQYLGEVTIGLIDTVGEFGKAVGTFTHGAIFLFVDSLMAGVHAVMALWDAMHGNFGGAKNEMGNALKSLKSDLQDLYDASVGWVPHIFNSMVDLFTMHKIGHSVVNEAIYQHNHAMGDFFLDNDPQTGFTRSSKSGSGHSGHSGSAGKSSIGKSTASVQAYDEAIQLTAKDQQKFTNELYATGDALGKQILAMDKSIESNKQKNEDERATYGMSVQQQIAYFQQELANLDKFDADYYQRTAQLTAKIQDLQTQEYKQEYDAAKKAHDDQLKLIDDWANKGVALFDTFFQKGKNGFKSFADAFKQMLDNMLQALEKSALIELLGKILGVNVGSFGSVFGQQSGLSGLGVFSAAATVGSSSAGLGGGGIAGLLGLGGAGATGVGGSAFTGAAGTYDASLAQAYVANGMSPSAAISAASGTSGGKGLFGLSSGFGTTANPGLGAYMAAATGGAMIGQTVFGGKGYADVGGALGAAAAMALAGPVGWAALAAMTLGGALLGGGLGSLFGNHFDPANEPDIYQQDAWGQENADMTGGEWTANGKQYNPDSWTNQATHNKGWNIVMENFVAKFRGKTSQLPQSLQAVFQPIEALWGGAQGQADFNHDGKDGYLDIGSGKRAKWSEFWSYVASNGPQIAQLMDNYESADMFNSQNGTATSAGSYTPNGSPWILHDFPDYGGGGATAPVGSPAPIGGHVSGPPGGGGPGPAPLPINGPGPGGGSHLHPAAASVNVFVQGSVLTDEMLTHAIGTGIAVKSRTNIARRMNLVGKR